MEGRMFTIEWGYRSDFSAYVEIFSLLNLYYVMVDKNLSVYFNLSPNHYKKKKNKSRPSQKKFSLQFELNSSKMALR